MHAITVVNPHVNTQKSVAIIIFQNSSPCWLSPRKVCWRNNSETNDRGACVPPKVKWLTDRKLANCRSSVPWCRHDGDMSSNHIRLDKLFRRKSNAAPYLDSVPCKLHLVTGKGSRFEVMVEFKFNEQTKALPLDLLYFLPADNQLKECFAAAPSSSPTLPPLSLSLSLYHSVIYYAGLIWQWWSLCVLGQE